MMAPGKQIFRWLGLEVSGGAYAIDLASVATVFHESAEAASPLTTGAKRPFLNLHGLMIRNGQPLFLLPAADLLSAENPLSFGQDVFTANPNQSLPPWVVVLTALTPDGAQLGLRVDRASGPFRTELIPSKNSSPPVEIEHMQRRWTIARLNPELLTRHTPEVV